METIRNYLESMFAQLPNTPEVWKAKNELYQMMEDKYNELREDGKSDNEAVGIVISEFGNLDELAESLGITAFMGNQPVTGKNFAIDSANAMIADKSKAALIRGVGVFFFINSVLGPIYAAGITDWVGGRWEDGLSAIGVTCLFAAIAIGVGLCIYAGTLDAKWKFLRQEVYRIDYQTADAVSQQMENYRTTASLLKIIGIMLFILCCVPVIVFGALSDNDFFGIIGVSGLFLMVGIGVLLIMASSGRMAAFREILALNDRSTIAGSYVPEQNEVRYNNETVTNMMSVYWPTVTCLYLIYSFLTFRWWISWIIWPVAAIIRGVINTCFQDKTNGGMER